MIIKNIRMRTTDETNWPPQNWHFHRWAYDQPNATTVPFSYQNDYHRYFLFVHHHRLTIRAISHQSSLSEEQALIKVEFSRSFHFARTSDAGLLLYLVLSVSLLSRSTLFRVIHALTYMWGNYKKPTARQMASVIKRVGFPTLMRLIADHIKVSTHAYSTDSTVL